MQLLCAGGLSVPNDNDIDSFSSQALRRARIDLIFKDYEVMDAVNAQALKGAWLRHVTRFKF